MFEMVALMLLSQQPLVPVAEGVASYYTVRSSSRLTASGEKFSDEAFTCAMMRGEFGKFYLVVSEEGDSVVCRLNDRGPYVKGRVIDLSKAAIRQLHPKAGMIRVKVYELGKNLLNPLVMAFRESKPAQ